jgi:cytochrome c6
MRKFEICRRAAAILLGSTLAMAIGPVLAGDEEVDEKRIELGREVFIEIAVPQCAICHTLADAGAEGEVGPILDQLRPDYDTVRTAVVEGIGPMKPYVDLTEGEIDAVAYYVSTVTKPAED